MTGDRQPRRRRSEESRRAIFTATMEGLQEHGYAALTVEGIAARAGAGKQTIYRWWPSKADVVLDAMLDMTESRITVPNEGSLSTDLSAFLRSPFGQRGQRPALTGLIAQALLDPVFAATFRDRFLFRLRSPLRELLDRAVVRGEIADDVDPELLIDVVYGVLWYRLLLEPALLDEEACRPLVALVVRAAQ
ncbi:TetR/AcrR family transcriptional regulator [Streptomyces sp. NPDC006475]|uniref:TetR/AcrR family transcriptional regulator n=1 Tax=Streptomyces sp. NPDC006475 TaxID=3155719 RepID=UPI0033B9833F